MDEIEEEQKTVIEKEVIKKVVEEVSEKVLSAAET